MFQKTVAFFVCVTLILSTSHPVSAQEFSLRSLPAPGSMVSISKTFVPLTLNGLIVHPNNALKFDFLMDTGHSALEGQALKDQALTMMKYFLTALTMPEGDMWVNLSPYEKGRIVEDNFGGTLMGRDLLAEDYVLKQLTASLIYPEDALGKKFWEEVYRKAGQEIGTIEIPVNTFNKVWIVPSKAAVWEHDGKVLIVQSRLKVMLEEDYLALHKNTSLAPPGTALNDKARTLASQAVRSIILPVLEKEVNEGEHFAQLRQMYQAMILATWYKKALKDSVVAKVYANKKKIKGVDNANVGDVEGIYKQYLAAFKKGAFNYIKEDHDAVSGQNVPRKYFSGGFSLGKGLTSLALALVVWSGALTPTQAAAANMATTNVGRTILVQSRVTEIGLAANTRAVANKIKLQDNLTWIDKPGKDWNSNDWQSFSWVMAVVGSIGVAIFGAVKIKPFLFSVKSTRIRKLLERKAVEKIATYLEDKDFHIRNIASDALHQLGDPRGDYIYAYHPEIEGKFINLEFSVNMNGMVGDWEPGTDSYWEKVKRSDAAMKVQPEQRSWNYAPVARRAAKWDPAQLSLFALISATEGGDPIKEFVSANPWATAGIGVAAVSLAVTLYLWSKHTLTGIIFSAEPYHMTKKLKEYLLNKDIKTGSSGF